VVYEAGHGLWISPASLTSFSRSGQIFDAPALSVHADTCRLLLRQWHCWAYPEAGEHCDSQQAFLFVLGTVEQGGTMVFRRNQYCPRSTLHSHVHHLESEGWVGACDSLAGLQKGNGSQVAQQQRDPESDAAFRSK
jgi:hypothetical protein